MTPHTVQDPVVQVSELGQAGIHNVVPVPRPSNTPLPGQVFNKGLILGMINSEGLKQDIKKGGGGNFNLKHCLKDHVAK